jgi:hypothetical protein
MTFDSNYPDNPWDGIATNQRTWYDPFLREVFLREAVYGRFATTQYNLAGPGSPVSNDMRITSLIPPHGNFDSIDLRALWSPKSYIDSFERRLSFLHYGGALAFHAFDQLVTYWQKDGVGGLQRIVNNGLGQNMTEQLDKLARNAYLSSPYALYADGAGTGFDDIVATDYLSTDLVKDIRLGMAERGVPFTTTPNASYQGATLLCVTTPGAIRDLTSQANSEFTEFVDVMRYADPSRIVRGEVGAYLGVRFVETPRAILYNCGTISKQCTIDAAANVGDGVAYSTAVDGVRYVGQASGVTNYIQLSDFATGDFLVNDIITLHTDRTSSFGVANGVDYRDGTLQERRIESVDASTNRITLDYPIMWPLATDLGGGVYGYATKGVHVHTSTFIGGMDGVVLGVGKMPTIHTPRPVDDFEAQYRFSWDAYLKYQVFEPESFEVIFHGGSNRVKGPRV